MSDKPRRRWFQFHLSTAVVLTLIAGGILWINTHEATQKWRHYSLLTVTGWPFSITESFHLDAQKERAAGIDFELADSDKIERNDDGEVVKIERSGINLTGLLLDVGVP